MKIAQCHPDRPHYCKNLCNACYQKERSSTDAYKQRQRAGSKKHYLANKEKILANCKKWNSENKERRYATQREWQKKNLDTYLWIQAKGRAKKRNLPFDITPKDIVVPETCPVLGIPIIPFGARFAATAPSIDRIDSTKGYTKDNIVVISFRANCIKNNATVEELKKIYEFYSSLEHKDQKCTTT